ncbi:MAG: Mfa1 family fimbria major subunit [Muribaculaceae bacterium]|nr:Mfa1 family fimbria major subunit [Muribaculaceae bacterium]
MKKIYGFAFAAAVMALASCSNDSEPVNNQNPVVDPDGVAGYIAVNIATPQNSRSTNTVGDGGFALGEGKENLIDNVKFVILANDNGTYKVSYTIDKSTAASDWKGPADFPNTVEMIGGTTLVIPNTAVNPNNTTTVDKVDPDMKLLVILNPGSISITNNMDEATLMSKVEAVTTDFSEAASRFVMTNSSYITTDESGNDVEVKAIKLDSKYLMATTGEAQNNPVEVYVERAVARADYQLVGADQDSFYGKNDLYWNNNSGEKVTLVPEIQAVAFFNNPDKTLLFKNISGWNSTWNGANDAANFRSYWATMPETGITQPTYSFNEYVAANAWDGSSLKKDYIRENTYGAADKKQTKVVVLAQLKEKKDDGTLGDAKDMACIFGQFTSKDGAAALVASTLRGLGYRVETTNYAADGSVESREYRTINYTNDSKELAYTGLAVAGNDIDDTYAVEEGKGNRTYLKLNITLGANERLVKENGVKPNTTEVNWEAATEDEINALLKKDYAISYWNNGLCYYYTDIEHLKFGQDDANPGVVRNHVYQINFNGINGFGTPIFDPDKKLIPTKPEYNEGENVFLAAHINVLRWKVVSNNVILE